MVRRGKRPTLFDDAEKDGPPSYFQITDGWNSTFPFRPDCNECVMACLYSLMPYVASTDAWSVPSLTKPASFPYTVSISWRGAFRSQLITQNPCKLRPRKKKSAGEIVGNSPLCMAYPTIGPPFLSDWWPFERKTRG